MLRRIAIALLAVMLAGCAVKVGGRANYRELTVAQAWTRTQVELAERTNGGSLKVPYALFTWKFGYAPVRLEQPDGSIMMGLGYFNPMELEIFITIPAVPGQVIEHEACHAILFVLGDREFVNYCHDPRRSWLETKN